MTTLRNALGTKNLMDILVEREATSRAIEKVLDDATDPWGVKVERAEIKGVVIPEMLQRAMAAEAEASREARVKVNLHIDKGLKNVLINIRKLSIFFRKKIRK